MMRSRGFRLLTAMCLLALPGTAQLEPMNNPVQVRFESFSIEIGPTNNARPLALKDANTILGMIEDLITNFAREHYQGFGVSSSSSTKALEENGPKPSDDMEFKYAILGLVDIPTHPEEQKSLTTTILEFSGGIAYFGGSPDGMGPSAAEVQLLVSLALNEGDLLDSIQADFPYISEATYTRGSAYAEAQSSKEPSTDVGSDNDASSLIDSPIALDGDNQDSREQMIIIIVSACAAAVVFCLLLAIIYLIRQRQRRAFWRDDSHPNIRNSNKTPVTVPEQDAALEDLSLDQGYAPKSMKDAKQQSLHLRDSLRDMSMQDQDVNDVQSDTGSNRLGRLLSSAASAAVCTKQTGIDVVDLEKDAQASGTALPVDPNGDQDTSSCSNDDSSNESVHSKDYDTCPSDFEGNAIVKPNLLPVTNMDRFNDDDPRNPLPPSQTAAARQDDSLIALSMDADDEPAPGPTFSLAPKTRPEGFLAKYFHPITGNILPLGSVGLSYFSSATHDDDDEDEDDGNDADCEGQGGKRLDHLTPRTATTAGDHDSRWSDVSSDYKTDDDFEQDQAWDPDDTSVNSSECGKEIFSPMSSGDDDGIRLLDSLGNHSYNLGKLRTPPKAERPGSAPRTPQDVANTEAV